MKQLEEMQQEVEQSHKEKHKLGEIMQMKEKEQRLALMDLERRSEQARLEQEKNFRVLEQQRKKEADEQMLKLQVIKPLSVTNQNSFLLF